MNFRTNNDKSLTPTSWNWTFQLKKPSKATRGRTTSLSFCDEVCDDEVINREKLDKVCFSNSVASCKDTASDGKSKISKLKSEPKEERKKDPNMTIRHVPIIGDEENRRNHKGQQESNCQCRCIDEWVRITDDGLSNISLCIKIANINLKFQMLIKKITSPIRVTWKHRE